MKTIHSFKKIAAVSISTSILFASCASKTMIQSNPSNAKLYINDEYAGTTPFSYKDTKILGSTNDVRLEKEGYETFYSSFTRNEKADVGAIIGGVFVLVPFLWTMKYKDSRTYELLPVGGTPEKKEALTNASDSKAKRLRDLKQLLDEEVITKAEFEKEKEKILNE